MPTPWKQLERDAAAALGGKRHLRAHRGEPGPDVDLPADLPFAVECKYRKALPKLLLEGLAQARRSAGKDKIPLLIVKQHRQQGALAVLDLGDFMRLSAPGRPTDAQEGEGRPVSPTPLSAGSPSCPARSAPAGGAPGTECPRMAHPGEALP